MKNNNVDDKDLTIKKLKEELKKEKKLRFDYKDIIDFYNNIPKFDITIDNVKSQCFFKNLNEFFIKLENFIKTINSLIKTNYDKDKNDSLSKLLKICSEIKKYKKMFKQKEKEDIVDGELCKIFALIIDLLTYMKFEVRKYSYEQIRSEFEEMTGYFYFPVSIDSCKEKPFSCCSIKFGTLFFFNKSNIENFQN